MARKKSPAQVRVALTQARRLGAASALQQLQFEFTSPEAVEKFNEWRIHPVTLLMLESLRELGVTPPAGYIDTSDIGVQYGVTSGIDLSHAFLSDPRVLYPLLFTGRTPGARVEVPETDYTADPVQPAGSGTN